MDKDDCVSNEDESKYGKIVGKIIPSIIFIQIQTIASQATTLHVTIKSNKQVHDLKNFATINKSIQLPGMPLMIK